MSEPAQTLSIDRPRAALAVSPSLVRDLPLSLPVCDEKERDALLSVLTSPKHSGGGRFTAACHASIEALVPGGRAFLTTSCTAALEMACLLLRIGPGDEVIMPSWTFCSTANAVALRGAVPVFVDVLDATLNLDPERVAAAVTPRTRAVLCVHYAGVGCDMGRLEAICAEHGLVLVEDAAQASGAMWRNRPLGGFGALSAFSFHDTKNLSCGEGGALVVNDPELVHAAECAWEKGTDRLRFVRGEVQKYNWVTLGSSYLPSELNAAVLSVQLQKIDAVTAVRLQLWHAYHELLAPLEEAGMLRRPSPPPEARHNAHIYFVRLDARRRDAVSRRLRGEGIGAVSHYEPLHLSQAGQELGRSAAEHLPVTETAAREILRLPLFPGMSLAEQERVVERLAAALA